MNPCFVPKAGKALALASALASLSMPSAAQAGFTSFGSSCVAGMSLSAGALPQLGTAFPLLYTGQIGSVSFGSNTQISQPVLLVGLSNTQAGGAPLPATLPLTLTGGVACDLRVSADVAVLVPTSTPPPFALQIQLPTASTLVGFTFHAQWLLVSERRVMGQTQWVRFFTSNAGTAVLGP